MTGHPSSAVDLVLHAPRVLGFASAHQIAAHYRLDLNDVVDCLLHFGDKGWVAHTRFADTSDWT